jgi:hypothetical protein
MTPLDHATLPQLLSAYLEADYRWHVGGQWQPLRVGEAAPTIEAAYPQARRFGLVSAWNPHSRSRPETENRSQDAALCKALADSGCEFTPAFGSGLNRTWREPSWGVLDMNADDFDALGRRFGQLGTLWWPRGATVRLRMYAPQGGCAAHPAVDWPGA